MRQNHSERLQPYASTGQSGQAEALQEVENQAATIDWCQMRQTIARIARDEERRWTRSDGTKYWENDPSRLPILESYWRTVPGFTSGVAATLAARDSATDNTPWSAAFICYVMQTAGIRQTHGFEFSQRHITYIVGALRNRERSDRTRVFWLADQIEVQSEAAPETGDLLCFNRVADGALTQHSYESLRRDYWLNGNQNREPAGSSHCSIVVGQVERAGRRFIQIIGGNEGAPGSGARGVTVGLREIPVDRFGGIPNPQAHHIFGIIKLVGCDHIARPDPGQAVLGYGARGSAVHDLQQRLNMWLVLMGRPRLNVDGIFGSQVESAVKLFQTAMGLRVDGIVGTQTDQALRTASKGASSQSQGIVSEAEAYATESEEEAPRNSRDYIKWVQQSLNQIMGLKLAVDGVVGTQTRSAIRTFQQRQGLVVDGIVGVQTDAALRKTIGRGTTPSPQPAAAPRELILGLDTASVAENKNPNWIKAKIEAGIRFAIIRSNFATYEDSVFKRDWPRIKEAGMVRGAYMFLLFPHPKYNMRAPNAASQAQKLIKVVGRLERSDLPPALDVEFPGSRKITKLSAEQCLERVRAAWKVLKDYYGVAPLIYTSGRVWKEDLNNLAASDLAESPLWLARYPIPKGPAVYDPRDAKLSRLSPPPVPPPWGDSTNWWIHQYQGDAVRLPGFPSGNVDLNRFNQMQKGASGDRVRWVQRRLGIAATGQFDDAMESTLRAFQNKNGLAVNGTVDVQTFAYLCWENP